MLIELIFAGAPGNLTGAVAEIRIQDVMEADAPAQTIVSRRIEGFSIAPRVVLDSDLELPPDRDNLSIFVKVQAVDESRRPVTFLTTTTTPLPVGPVEGARVVLEPVA